MVTDLRCFEKPGPDAHKKNKYPCLFEILIPPDYIISYPQICKK